MTVLLDTHALLWYASDSYKLTALAKQRIEEADWVYVSAMSAWEIGMLVSKDRLSLRFPVNQWIELSYQLPKLRWVSVTPEIGVLATNLPGLYHGDPADRLIVASALAYGSALITADQKIHSYMHIECVWYCYVA